MEKEYIAKMFAEYHELCELSNGKIITLEAKDYGCLKSTLDVLEMGGYIRDLNIDGGHIYAVDESFEYFETNMRAELGVRIPTIIELIQRIPDIKKNFSSAFGTVKSIHRNEEFIQWKSQLQYELQSLKQDVFIMEISTLLDSINKGWDDEKKFAELEAKLSILEKNIDKYLICEQDTEVDSGMSNKKVFIVHGHDEQLLNEVELMIRRIGLEPIILKNEASGGRTIIEKIEHYTDVGFGIVLYTCCDEGRKKGTDKLQDRARQNVIFEHGYLCAKINRDRVVALNDSGIEVPSDLAGVVYISHSDADWKNQIMREMKNAGLIFDSTKA